MRIRFKFMLILIIISLTLPVVTSCSSARKSGCIANNTYGKQKKKKNKSNYGTKYGYKSNSPRKQYIIKNRDRL